MNCAICPRRCGVERAVSKGYCNCGDSLSSMRIGLVSRHMWEEPPISGTMGSGTIFFAGCNLRCVYCQNFELSRGKEGRDVTPKQLADIFAMLDDSGVHNINLVTAGHCIEGILSAMDIYRPKIPVVFNCGGYESEEQILAIKDIVDIWLPDYKYSQPDIAREYSNAPDYPDVANKAIALMRKLQPKDEYDRNGIMLKGVIIRHMVLPSHIENTKGVLDNIYNSVGRNTCISLMSQYYPCGDADKYPPISRGLKPLEYKLALSAAQKRGFENLYVQELSSSDSSYTPVFNGYLGERGI